MGRKISSNRMEITVPNTLSDCTTNAVVHCLSLPPPSSGAAAMMGGAMMYRNSMLKMRATQLSRMVTRLTIEAIPAKPTRI